jgi:hypothetical protein
VVDNSKKHGVPPAADGGRAVGVPARPRLARWFHHQLE